MPSIQYVLILIASVFTTITVRLLAEGYIITGSITAGMPVAMVISAIFIARKV
ncbi:MAG: hypothetical protein V4668_00790 [Patescibacteria group bacterium]